MLYSWLQTISTKEEDGNRYFMKADINFSKMGEMFNLSRQTVSNKFKNLMGPELELVVPVSKTKYLLKDLPNTDASLVPYSTLKLLVDALSENSISIYAHLIKRYYANDLEPFKITLKQLKEQIGICSSTRSNNDIITNILFVLQKLGLIEYSMTTEVQDETNFKNVKTIYQIDRVMNKIEMN